MKIILTKLGTKNSIELKHFSIVDNSLTALIKRPNHITISYEETVEHSRLICHQIEEYVEEFNYPDAGVCGTLLHERQNSMLLDPGDYIVDIITDNSEEILLLVGTSFVGCSDFEEDYIITFQADTVRIIKGWGNALQGM